VNLATRIRRHKFIVMDLALILCVFTISQLWVPPENMGEVGSSVQALIAQYPNLADFRLSAAAEAEVELLQRATEMFWPRRSSPKSTNLIALVDEKLPVGCELKGTFARIKYAVCL